MHINMICLLITQRLRQRNKRDIEKWLYALTKKISILISWSIKAYVEVASVLYTIEKIPGKSIWSLRINTC